VVPWAIAGALLLEALVFAALLRFIARRRHRTS
jgi:hypothetical protein